MGVLFGERGNSFISFFQQSAAGQHGATATEERGVQPRIKRNYIAFVSSDRKQLRVNKRRIRGGGKDEGKEEERFNLLESRRVDRSYLKLIRSIDLEIGSFIHLYLFVMGKGLHLINKWFYTFLNALHIYISFLRLEELKTVETIIGKGETK